MKTKQWEIVKGLINFEQTVSLVYYFQYKDELSWETDDYRGYVIGMINYLYEGNFNEEVDFNLNILEPNERVYYLLEIAEFLYDNKKYNFEDESLKEFDSIDFDENSQTFVIPKNKFTEEVQKSIINERTATLNTKILGFVVSGVEEFYKNQLKSINISIQNARSMRNLMGSNETALVTKQIEVTIDPIVFEHINHKLVFLDELGIFNFLTEKYKVLNESRDANLAAIFHDFIFDKKTKEQAKLETIKKALNILFSTDGNNKTRTEGAINNAKSQMKKFGIDL